MSGNQKKLPAEWQPQKMVQLSWPHYKSDWAYLIHEVEATFVEIAKAIAKHEPVLIVCHDIDAVKLKLPKNYSDNIYFFEIESNDTWARDHGGIVVFDNNKPTLYDFCFNGWGMKFAANFDNQITRKLYQSNAFPDYNYQNMNFFVLEGGSIESDGNGTLLTTEECLLSPNRNDSLSKSEIEAYLKQFFGAERILWLKNGYLAGDDTDSHIDTLARFCNENTIAYVKCDDKNDEHYLALSKMEEELQNVTQANGEPYQLIELPMATAVYDPDDGHRLPSTYANFLIVNGAVLLPVYNCETDAEAIEALRSAFPDREIIPIDCSVLIRQHGSLHCVTMQYPVSTGSTTESLDNRKTDRLDNRKTDRLDDH